MMPSPVSVRVLRRRLAASILLLASALAAPAQVQPRLHPAPNAGTHSDYVTFTGPDGLTYPDYTFAGKPGGVPNTSTWAVYNVTQYGASGGDTLDDRQAFANAVAASAASPNGAVIYVPDGTYYFDDLLVVNERSNLLFKGQSRANTRLILRNFATNPEATKAGHIDFVGGGDTTFGGYINVTASAPRGAMQLTLATGSTLPAVGSVIEVTRQNVPAEYLEKWDNSTPRENIYFDHMEVTAVSGQTLTISQPVRVDLQAGTFSDGAGYARVRTRKFSYHCGVENLTLECTKVIPDNADGDTAPNNYNSGVRFRYVWGGWIYNVDLVTSGSYPWHFSRSKHGLVKNVLVDRAWNVGGAGNGYAGFVSSNDCLMEDCTVYAVRHAPNVQDRSSGNVIRNGTFYGTDAQFHTTWTLDNLFENLVLDLQNDADSYQFWSNDIATLDNAFHPHLSGNAVYHCDFKWQGRGIRFGGLTFDWVFAHNRVQQNGQYGQAFTSDRGPSASVTFSDWCDNVVLHNNVFCNAEASGATLSGGVYFGPAYTPGPTGTGAYTTNGAANNTNIRITNNTFYLAAHAAGSQYWAGFDSPDINTGNQVFGTGSYTWNMASPPARPAPPVASLYEWQKQQKWGNVTVPPAPTGLSAGTASGQVSLSWGASSGAQTYTVRRGTSSGSYPTQFTGVTGTSYTDTAVNNGTTYYYVVAAVNSAGTSGNSNQVTATPQLSAPAAPTGLAASAGNGAVSLSWNAVPTATNYTVRRSTTSGSGYTNLPATTATSLVDSGRTNGTTYYYRVFASNAAGSSPDSAEVFATPNTDPQNGLVLRWKFDEGAGTTAADTGTDATANPGTIGGAATFLSSGVPVGAAALNLDGSNDYATTADQANLDVTTAFTITAWIDIFDPAMNRAMRVISKKSSATDSGGYELVYHPLSNYLELAGSGNTNTARVTSLNLDSTWHHVAVTVSNGTAAFYLDGVKLTTNVEPTLVTPGNSSQPFQVGRRGTGSDYFRGGLDDVRVYNRVLSDAEVQAVYSATQ